MCHDTKICIVTEVAGWLWVVLQYNNCIVTGAAGGLGKDCIAIHSSVL